MGWIQPDFLWIQKAAWASFDHKKGNAEDCGTCMNKSHVESPLSSCGETAYRFSKEMWIINI